MKKILGIILCFMCCICGLAVSATEQRASIGVYNLDGERQRTARLYLFDLTTIAGEEINLLDSQSVPGHIDFDDEILANANEGDWISVWDMRTDDTENPYPEIEPVHAVVDLPQPSGVPVFYGEEYRLFFMAPEDQHLTDISENILTSSHTSVDFTVSNLGVYVIYAKPKLYTVTFYNDFPSYDEEGNKIDPDVYYTIEGLNRDDVIEFPPVPEREGYAFTGWQERIEAGYRFTYPQPLSPGYNTMYFATWCPEDEYEPIEFTLTAEEPLIKGKENGKKFTLKTNYGGFSENDFPAQWRPDYDAAENEEQKAEILAGWKAQWKVEGSDELLVERVDWVDAKTLELTLSGNSSEIYNDSQIRIGFHYELLKPETNTSDIKIQMDEDGVRAQMYKTESLTISRQKKISRPSGFGSASSYTVQFESNGGSKISNQRVSRNNLAKEPAPPTRDGYTFIGWYMDKECAKAYDFRTKVTKNMTLYAKWENETDNQILLTIGKKEALVFGETKTNDVTPILRNERTMLPARFVAENLGAKVDWQETGIDRGIVTVTKDDIKIVLTIDSATAYVNDKPMELDSPAFIENDRTYTPLRFLAEKLGATVEWNDKTQTAVITQTERE